MGTFAIKYLDPDSESSDAIMQQWTKLISRTKQPYYFQKINKWYLIDYPYSNFFHRYGELLEGRGMICIILNETPAQKYLKDFIVLPWDKCWPYPGPRPPQTKDAPLKMEQKAKG